MSTKKNRPSVYDKARCARIAAVQGCFQNQLTQTPFEMVKEEFKDIRFSDNDDYPASPNEVLFKNLLFQTSDSFDDIVALLGAVLSEDSKLSRQDPVIRAILFIATAELMNGELFPTPAPVIISEYVAITEGFSDQKQASFMNRILDAIARKLGRPLSVEKKSHLEKKYTHPT